MDNKDKYFFMIDISSYKSGSGYQYTTTIESGHNDRFFEAKTWFNETKDDLNIADDEWLEIKISFYNKDDDPMFDKPIYTSEYTTD